MDNLIAGILCAFVLYFCYRLMSRAGARRTFEIYNWGPDMLFDVGKVHNVQLPFFGGRANGIMLLKSIKLTPTIGYCPLSGCPPVVLPLESRWKLEAVFETCDPKLRIDDGCSIVATPITLDECNDPHFGETDETQ